MTAEIQAVTAKLEEFAKRDLKRLTEQDIEAARAAIVDFISTAATDRDEQEIKTILTNSRFTNFNMNILHVIAKFGDERDLDETLHFLQDPAFIEVHDVNNFTPMHYAAKEGWLGMVQTLINHGADKNPRASSQYRQWTPIHFAAKHGHFEIVKLLLDSGVDRETVTGFGLTPLHVAAEFGHPEIARYLLDIGVKRDGKSVHENHEMTPLHYAAMGKFHDVVVMLLESGASCDPKMTNGMNALQIAAQHGEIKTVDFLLRRGCSMWDEALEVAKERGHQQVVQLIEKFINVRKNLFKNINDISGNLASQIRNFNRENLREEKISLENGVTLNAYGILHLSNEIGGLFKKKEHKTLMQIALDKGESSLADALKNLSQLASQK